MNVDERNEKQPKTGTIRSIARSLFPRRPLHWVGVAMALGVVAAVGGGAVSATGVADISAVPPHPEGWARLLRFSSKRSFAEHAGHPEPAHEPLDSPAMVMSGAANYAVVCADCHGAPGYGQSPIALSMRPEPPMIVDVSKSYSDAELFWVVKNGVRYAGMPAWPVSNRPDEIWAMVAFIKAMPGMNRDTYNNLAGAGERSKLASLDRPQGGNLPGSAPSNGEAVGTTMLTSADIASPQERPYLPGDPQDPGSSPAAVVAPRTGFLNIGAGGDPTAACTTCHGADGAGRPGGAFPNLTLQSPQYLYDALRAFSTGQRQSGVMWPIAASLTDEQMRGIAARFGTAKPVAANEKSTAGSAPLGNEVARDGVENPSAQAVNQGAEPPKGAVERCSSCHLPGAYLGKVIPQLNGQRAAYTRMQLYAFRAGGRGDTGPYDPMVSASHNLTDAEIKALGDYYASLPPFPKTSKN